VLRQPKTVSKKEKYAYVEEVIKMLNMADFANAVVGVPGEGLNVEQRKLLTIGVELAAKPKLLLFLDEPTSGLDSQVSMLISHSGVLHCFTVACFIARLALETF
jgi:ATP-binding cassette subfamily G (WHITE) protein 2 (PDR)